MASATDYNIQQGTTPADYERVRQENSLNYDSRDANGDTALHSAARVGAIPLVRHLVQKGGPFLLEEKNDNRTPLDTAIIAGQWGSVRELLKLRADPNEYLKNMMPFSQISVMYQMQISFGNIEAKENAKKRIDLGNWQEKQTVYYLGRFSRVPINFTDPVISVWKGVFDSVEPSIRSEILRKSAVAFCWRELVTNQQTKPTGAVTLGSVPSDVIPNIVNGMTE